MTSDRQQDKDIRDLARRIRRLEQREVHLHQFTIGTHDPAVLTTTFDVAPAVLAAIHLTPFTVANPMRVLRVSSLVRSDGVATSRFALAIYKATNIGAAAKGARDATSSVALRPLPRFDLIQASPSLPGVTVVDHVEFRANFPGEVDLLPGDVYAIGWQSNSSGRWRGGDQDGIIYRTLVSETVVAIGAFPAEVYPGYVSEDGTPFFMLRSAVGAGVVSA